MRRKIVNAMLPITCMSVLLLLLFCYETVKYAGVSRTERKRAEQYNSTQTLFQCPTKHMVKRINCAQLPSTGSKRNQKNGGKQNLCERSMFKTWK